MLEQLLKIWDRLTLSKLMLGVIGAFAAIFIYWLWEQRTSVFITVTGSPLALVIIAALMVMIAAAWVASMFVRVSEQGTQQVIKEMRARISDGEAHSARQDAEIGRLHNVIDVAIQDERKACDRQIEQLVQVMREHGIHDKRMDSGHAPLR